MIRPDCPDNRVSSRGVGLEHGRYADERAPGMGGGDTQRATVAVRRGSWILLGGNRANWMRQGVHDHGLLRKQQSKTE